MGMEALSTCLSDYSTFGIGGRARKVLTIRTVEEMVLSIRQCRQQDQRWLVIGKGSNSLFDDKGFDGVVLVNRIESLYQDEGRFEVGAGYPFALLGTKAARLGWSGLEFAAGIPGSVGGAVVMNAGADGAETADVLQSVRVVTAQGTCLSYPREALQFGYRSSPFLENGEVVVGATFLLYPSAAARSRQLELIWNRKSKQPLQEKSAGCIFRNPSQISAGALIEQCGLKGFSIGDARVSELHANFIVNVGNATCRDVLALIAYIKQSVKDQTGIELHNEVRYIPPT